MPRTKPRKTAREFDADKIKGAVEEVLNGKSANSVATRLSISKATLLRYINKAKAAVFNGEEFQPQQNYDWSKVFTEQQEDMLVQYLINCSEMGFGLSCEQCRRLAYEMALKNNISFPTKWSDNSIAGKDWFDSFRKRHPELSVRKAEACSLARASAFNKVTVSKFYDNLQTVLDRDPNFRSGLRMFNLDETGTTTVQSCGKVLTLKGTKQVSQTTSGERGTLVTTCAIVGANGVVYPPAMVFPRAKVNPRMKIGAFPGTLLLAEKSGWMTAENYVKVMEHFIKVTNSSLENPSLLLEDNHDSHLSIEALELAKANGVTILTFPPHTTHKLQPLDRSVFGPFQRQYDKEVTNWMQENPGVTVTIYEIPSFVNQAMTASMTRENILAGFAATGLYPFNRDIFPDSEFRMSAVTDRPDPNAEEDNNRETGEEIESPEPAARSTASEERPQGTASPELSPVNTGTEATGTGTPPVSNGSQQLNPTSSSGKTVRSEDFQGPESFRGYPKAAPRKAGARKGRKKGASLIATDTPVKEQLKEDRLKRKNRSQSKPAPKRAAKKVKRAKKTLFTESSSEKEDDPAEISLRSEEDSGSEFEEPIPAPEPDTFPPLTRTPVKDEFVLICHSGKEDSYYIAKVMKEIDGDGDIEVNYLRKSAKSLGKFVFPNVPEMCSVPLADVKMILPTPSCAGTKRQQNLFNFAIDFSNLRMG